MFRQSTPQHKIGRQLLCAISFLYTGITCLIFHEEGNTPVIIDMFKSVAIGPATAGSKICNICYESLLTLLVAGDDSTLIAFDFISKRELKIETV